MKILIVFVSLVAAGSCVRLSFGKAPDAAGFAAGDADLLLPEHDENAPPTIFSGNVMKAQTLSADTRYGRNKSRYTVKTQNGIEIAQVGKLKDNKAFVVMGSYAYTGADGRKYRVTYTADELGYHPTTQLDVDIPDITPGGVAPKAPVKVQPPKPAVVGKRENPSSGYNYDAPSKSSSGYNYDPPANQYLPPSGRQSHPDPSKNILQPPASQSSSGAKTAASTPKLAPKASNAYLPPVSQPKPQSIQAASSALKPPAAKSNSYPSTPVRPAAPKPSSPVQSQKAPPTIAKSSVGVKATSASRDYLPPVSKTPTPVAPKPQPIRPVPVAPKPLPKLPSSPIKAVQPTKSVPKFGDPNNERTYLPPHQPTVAASSAATRAAIITTQRPKPVTNRPAVTVTTRRPVVTAAYLPPSTPKVVPVTTPRPFLEETRATQKPKRVTEDRSYLPPLDFVPPTKAFA